MKTLDSDLKVSRNIYPDAATCDMMRLIGTKSGHLDVYIYIYIYIYRNQLGNSYL